MNALLERPEISCLVKTDLTPDGYAPEDRLVLVGIGWENHLTLDEAFGHDCAGPRFYYLDGDLEIVSASDEPERIKKWIGGCIEIYMEHFEVETMPRGRATIRLDGQAVAEPDESWCINGTKKFPDLVLEVALATGGLPKLEIYRRFAIQEVWIWRRGRLEIHVLRADGSGYAEFPDSKLLPNLPIAALEAIVAERSWLKSRRDFRAALQA